MEEYIPLFPGHYLQERFWSTFIKNNFISCKSYCPTNDATAVSSNKFGLVPPKLHQRGKISYMLIGLGIPNTKCTARHKN